MSNNLIGFGSADGLGGCGCSGRSAGMAGVGASPDGLGAPAAGMGFPKELYAPLALYAVASTAGGYFAGKYIGRGMKNSGTATVAAVAGAAIPTTIAVFGLIWMAMRPKAP